MSTRAVYTFTGSQGDFHVYKHHDGYPYVSDGVSEGGGLIWIKKAKALAWVLPKFEADEFAAAFVAANKTKPNRGDVHLTEDPLSHADAEYWYKIKKATPALDVWVDVYQANYTGRIKTFNLIMGGALSEVLASERARRPAA